MRKKALTNNQRQKRHQWRKKQRQAPNADRQQDTINRLSKAVAALEGQSFPNQTKALAALTEQCYLADVIKPGHTTFKRYEHLWSHLVKRR